MATALVWQDFLRCATTSVLSCTSVCNKQVNSNLQLPCLISGCQLGRVLHQYPLKMSSLDCLNLTKAIYTITKFSANLTFVNSTCATLLCGAQRNYMLKKLTGMPVFLLSWCQLLTDFSQMYFAGNNWPLVYKAVCCSIGCRCNIR